MQRNKVADILARKASYSCSGTDRGYGACMVKMIKSDMLQDVCGHSWCSTHQHRGELLNWASEHGYPAIQFLGTVRPCYPVQGLPDCEMPTKYSIGFGNDAGNKELWEFAVMHGNEDMINAAIAYVGGQAS